MVIDANLLLFARDRSAVQHERARDWLGGVLNGGVRVGLPWASLLAFARISTHPRAYERPLSASEWWGQVEAWLAAPAAWIPSPTERHSELLGDLVKEHGVTGNLIPDAHIAALALEHGVAVCSADSDFARFTELRWVNPLMD